MRKDDGELQQSFDALDPGDRALLELSLQRGIPDDELARMLGTDEADIVERRRTALWKLAERTGDEPHDLSDRISALPVAPAAKTEQEDHEAEDAAAAVHGGEMKSERLEESRAGFWRSHSLSIFFLAIFLAALVGQSYAGWQKYNSEEIAHEESSISYTRYLTSSDFARAVTENWQSEYLQFVLYIMATIYFVQRGSPESKRVRDRGREDDEQQQLGRYARPDSPAPAKRASGLLRGVYSNSLLLWMGLIFVLSWFAQSVAGWSAYNSDELSHGENGTNWFGYIGTADFWESTLQNWQSEFLAVGSMAIFSVYLRQRGSPESKPVGAPHDETAATG